VNHAVQRWKSRLRESPRQLLPLGDIGLCDDHGSAGSAQFGQLLLSRGTRGAAAYQQQVTGPTRDEPFCNN
jgi:hypothetical protein